MVPAAFGLNTRVLLSWSWIMET